MKLPEIIKVLEDFAPPKLALPDDRIGLQIGNLNQKISKILVTLDITQPAVSKAVQRKANLIVSHHPLIFNPLTQITTPSIFEPILENRIAVYVAHTNLDICAGGVNDALAEKIGLNEIKVFEPVYTEKLFKLVVFAPQTHAEKIRLAICGSGAGQAGNYDQCTFLSHGTGTFRPLAGARPYLGRQGKIARVKEAKIETMVSEFKLAAVISALKKSHPYEEPVYDIYPLQNPGRVFGLGRGGNLKQPANLKSLAGKVKKALNSKNLQVIGNPNHKVKTAVIWSGRGRNRIQAVINSGADVFIVGEIPYEDMLEAKAFNLPLIIAGHAETENIIVKPLANYLKLKTDLTVKTV